MRDFRAALDDHQNSFSTGRPPARKSRMGPASTVRQGRILVLDPSSDVRTWRRQRPGSRAKEQVGEALIDTDPIMGSTAPPLANPAAGQRVSAAFGPTVTPKEQLRTSHCRDGLFSGIHTPSPSTGCCYFVDGDTARRPRGLIASSTERALGEVPRSPRLARAARSPRAG